MNTPLMTTQPVNETDLALLPIETLAELVNDLTLQIAGLENLRARVDSFVLRRARESNIAHRCKREGRIEV